MDNLFRIQSIIEPLYLGFQGYILVFSSEHSLRKVGLRQTRYGSLDSIDHGLREIVDSYLDRSFRSHQGSFSDRVRHAIRIHLSGPKANKTDIANMLAMHPRSLQRKLDEEGTSFEQIRDKLRQQLLLQYLADSKASMSQIASVLGISEQSALSRACKNWFGVTPRQLKKLRSGLQ